MRKTHTMGASPYKAMREHDWHTLEKLMDGCRAEPHLWFDYAVENRLHEAANWLASHSGVEIEPKSYRATSMLNLKDDGLRRTLIKQSLAWCDAIAGLYDDQAKLLTFNFDTNELNSFLVSGADSYNLRPFFQPLYRWMNRWLATEILARGANPAFLKPRRHHAFGRFILESQAMALIGVLFEQGFYCHLEPYEDEQPLLHWCAERGHLHMVKELIRRGADVRQVDANGLTAARQAGRFQPGVPCARYLLSVEGLQPTRTLKCPVSAPLAAVAAKPTLTSSAPGVTSPVLTCSVCLERGANVLTRPCRHLATCEVCALQLTNCPLCRGCIESTELIFTS